MVQESKSAAFLLMSFAVMLLVVCVSGKECRTSGTVVASAQNVDDNTAAGGHIWQHIRGLPARPKGAQKSETQLDKTLFASERDYQAAWQRFQVGDFRYLTPHQCNVSPKGQSVDCVLAADIGVRQAYFCTAVDKTSKLCTAETQIRPLYVEFWYAQKKGKWILNTAYPSEEDTPTASCKKIPTATNEERKKQSKNVLSQYFKNFLLQNLNRQK